MYKETFLLIALVGAFSGSAHAISKCTLADGKVVFQDTPCNGKGDVLTVRPASGHSQPPVEATPNGATGGTPDGDVTVITQYRARNSFNAVVTSVAVAVVSPEGELVSINLK